MKLAVCHTCLISDNCDLLFMTGGNLNAASRQALMQKLARIDPAPVKLEPVYVHPMKQRVFD